MNKHSIMNKKKNVNRVGKPVLFPIMAGAPSVHTELNFSHFYLLYNMEMWNARTNVSVFYHYATAHMKIRLEFTPVLNCKNLTTGPNYESQQFP